MIYTWLNMALKAAGMTEETPHSIRSSACIWALRCGNDSEMVKLGGRWIGSGVSWRKYHHLGSNKKQYYINKGRRDPVFSFWIWRPNVVANCKG